MVGWGSYLCDVLYISLFCNLLILHSKKMAVSFFLIPFILGIGIWQNLIKPMLRTLRG